MGGRNKLVIAALAAALGGGCGTVDNVRRPVYPLPNSPNTHVCRVYGGVRGDFGMMTEYPWRDTPSFIDYIVLPVMSAIDLGLSAFGDTVTLPYTVGVEVWRAFNPDPPPPRESLQVPVTVAEPAPPTGQVAQP
ncbi:hypothetical protein GobsT_24940 [Gemmata obscuriglobus]|nr:YceK/YidQ family lipoprotein [Gemmata obscuriglobus]QEG27734.1 hypothetical protein GobsT_24940 [Gemmata obscuriglobus]VTS04994.1 : DUF1375 [Gemmata obscuriglobus UQM 2246]